MNAAISSKSSKSVSIKPNKSVSIAATALALFSLGAEGLAQTAPAAPRPAHAAPAKSKPAPAPSAPAAVTPAAQDLTPAKTGSSDVVARVGDANLSADDIRAYVAALGPREQAVLTQDPALLSQAVRMLLANRLVLREVLAKKWDQQPGVAAQLERVRESALVELYLGAVSPT
jgi:hypothetical protein